ncbi:MAG TPA: gluconokinase [Ktedonobacteraceae bacterium]|nr:gluconokinase [Ktedonobacteraceae bacterium]
MTQNARPAGPETNFQPPFVLGLDVGTSSTRALLFDSLGAVVPEVLAQRTYKLTTSAQGEVSVDADALLDVVALTISDALAEAGPLAQQICAVAIDTFWHSLLGVDKAGRPIMPLITWEDTRPYQAALALRKRLDERAVHDRTGARFHASYWPAKLHWLAQEQPETFSRAAQWLSFGEYLHRRLLGNSVCSLSMASGTGMLETRARAWDKELMEALDVRPEQLPEPGDLHDSVQGLTSEYASAWPALRHVPWFPAIGDGAAACIGSGCANTDTWSLTIGTSSALRVVVAPEQVVPPMGLWLYLIDEKRAVLGGALSEGGNLLNWLDTALQLPSLRSAEGLIKVLEPDGHGLTILPFISGERSLGWHAEARMTVAGISIHTSPADLLRAGMEALAYQIRAVYEQLCDALKMEQGPQKIIGSGGALLGSTVLQGIIADTLGAAIYPSRDHEASARGAALLALEALGKIPDVAQVAPNLEAPVQPDAGRGVIYCKAAQRQRELYRLLLGDED